MIKVYSALDPTDAHVVKGILESRGIECEVTGEALFNIRGEIPLTPETAPSVWVLDESRFDEAREIVLAYQSDQASTPEDNDVWICPACGEDSEGQFAKCWNCGTPRHSSGLYPMKNIFTSLPDNLDNEVCDDLVTAPHVRIERIVSKGHTSPEQGWYDQDEHEWVLVLDGSGTLLFDDGTERTLSKGDHITIPAHTRHKVVWTDPETPTIWLAVFFQNG